MKIIEMLVLFAICICIISCTPYENTTRETSTEINSIRGETVIDNEEKHDVNQAESTAQEKEKELIVDGKMLTTLKASQGKRYEKGITKDKHLNEEVIKKLQEYEKEQIVVNYEDLILNYFDNGETKLLWSVAEDSFSVSLWINDKAYPYSYGRFGSFTEQPFVIIKDINNDGKNDILSYCFQYKTELRQDVYLSQPDGSYMELGDITWNPNSEEKAFEFSVEYKDNFMVHIQAPEYEIDVTEPIGEELQDVLKQLGVYEENGTLVEQGEKLISNQLQGKGITYAQDDNGKTYVIYDAPISLGYSDYHLPYGFQFVYMIGDNQYQLEKVSFIKD